MAQRIDSMSLFGARRALLVGRAREQALLSEQLDDLLAGHGRLVLVSGEAGIGKTTLIGWLAAEAAARGALVLVGGCYDRTTTPPYGPWRELTARYPADATLPPLPPALRPGEPLDGIGSQAALFALVQSFLTDASRARPLLLVLEDVHWADEASLDLLRVLARALGSSRIVLIASYRTDEITRLHRFYELLPLLLRESAAVRLEVAPIDRAALEELVAARYLLAAADAERLAAYLMRRAEGNPFYTTELLHALEARGLLAPAGSGWRLGDLGRLPVPELVRQVIDLRLDGLDADVRQALRVAAVIGHVVPLDLWRAAGGLDDARLLDVIDQATEARLVEATADGTAIHFQHALPREALYESVLPMRRRLLHREIGAALAAAPRPDPDEVAHHFQAAADERAADWLVLAGERAQRGYALVMASERYDAAARVLDGNPERERERGWLLYRAGRPLRFSAPLRGLAFLDQALRVAERVGDRVLAAYARFDQGHLRAHAGQVRDAIGAMEAGLAALDALTEADFGGDAARIDAWVAHALPADVSAQGARPHGENGRARPVTLRRSNFMVWAAGAGRFQETVAAGQACVADLATSAPGDAAALSALGDVQYALAMAYAALGRPDDAQHAFARARDAYRAIDHHLMLRAVSEWEICVVAQPYHADQPALRRRLAVESAAARERSSGAYVSNEQHGLLSLAPLLLDGEWDVAREIGRSWLAGRLKHSALGVGATLGVCMLIQLMRDQGDTAPAWELITTFLPDGPRTAAGGASFRDGIELLRLAAELSLDAGDLAAAARWIDAHDRWLVWSGSVLNQAEGRLLRARSARAAGDLTQAYSHAEAALACASEPRQPLALLAAQRCLGELAADAGRYDTANEHLAASLALAEECAAPFERALTLLAQAELQAASGNAGDARTLAAQVRAICAPLDARPTLARVAALDARLSGQDGGASPGPARLSPRETEVLRLLAAGHSTKEIAAELGMRVRTAERHIQNLYHKLGVTGRAAAIALAHQHGLT